MATPQTVPYQVEGINFPLFPEVEVNLSYSDGNALMILGTVSKSMQQAKINPAKITEFTDEACSGSYNHLLQTVLRTVTVN